MLHAKAVLSSPCVRVCVRVWLRAAPSWRFYLCNRGRLQSCEVVWWRGVLSPWPVDSWVFPLVEPQRGVSLRRYSAWTGLWRCSTRIASSILNHFLLRPAEHIVKRSHNPGISSTADIQRHLFNSLFNYEHNISVGQHLIILFKNMLTITNGRFWDLSLVLTLLALMTLLL